MMENELDVRKATEIAIRYLESIYGSLNMALFRIEEVRKNGDKTKYYIICSLITSLGSSKRTYYSIKLDIETKSLSELQKGYRDDKTNNINWERINLPPE